MHAIHPDPIKTVAITGGTHGDERTGVALVRHWLEHPDAIARPSFQTTALLTNTPAIAARQRDVGLDLNRAFALANLEKPPHPIDPPEAALARTLNTQLGPKGEHSKTDLLLDLHSACSNMGLNINITGGDPWCFRLAAHTIRALADAPEPLPVRCYQFPAPHGDAPYLPTIALRGIGIEVGPVAPNALDATIYFATERLVHALLDAVHAYNSGEWRMDDPPTELQVFTQVGQLSLPLDADGEPQAMLHPERLHAVYEPIEPGDPLFVDFHGNVTPYTGEPGLVTTFVNEPSYMPAGIALCLARPAMRRV